MQSPAAPAASVTQLLRHLSVRLVRLWHTNAPAALQSALPPLDLGALLHPPRWHTPLERQAQLQQALTLASWLLERLTPHLSALAPPLQARVEDYLFTISKVIAEETCTDASGYVQQRDAEHKGRYR